jgi:lipopolysaccharide/colanic/teichoic acid biosynthesis glycosyltransferase
LALLDGAAGLVLIVLGASIGEARAAALVVVVCLIVSFALGRYRESYAVRPADERYAVACAALVSGVGLIALVPIFQVSPLASFGTLVLWALVSAMAAMRVTQTRRAATSEPEATCRHLSMRSRSRVRKGLIREALTVLDATLAATAMVALSPVFIACAIAIAVEDGGPVLFQQLRTGVNGRSFVMYKFRTMRIDAGNEWAKPNDERITHVGAFLRRTSLDELPQLWNVVRGDMSLVGPRPEMCEYAVRFARTIPDYEDRQAIPPGITGWAQIHYNRNFQPEESAEVVPYDLFYVANYSVPLYLYCLTKTACEVLAHRAV